MRVIAVLCLLSTTLLADVAVLKDGSRVSGRIVEKAQSWEVTTEGGLRTFLKEEVEKIIKDPKELLGDVDKVIAAAKDDYQRAVAMVEGPERNALLRESITKIDAARAAVSSTRELFPEDKFADLDQKLMQVMQLKRLLRDRLHSEFASGTTTRVGPARASSVSLEEAFSTLLDPAKRSDAGRRASAREAFRIERALHPEIYELATAAMLFLSRSDAEWNLQGPSLAALQDYFDQSWLKQPTAMTPALHQAAAQWIVELQLSRWVLLAAILLMVVVLGFFLPPVSIILMTAPIILPPLKAAGFNLIWFGVVMTIVMEMGLIHPPVGLNIFVIKSIAPDIPLRDVIWGVMPFVVLMMISIVLLGVFPEIATWFANAIMGTS